MSDTTSGFVSSTSGGPTAGGWKPLSAKETNKAPSDGILGRIAVRWREWTNRKADDESAEDIRHFRSKLNSDPAAAAPHVLPAMTTAPQTAKPEDEEPLALQICGLVSELWQQWEVKNRCKRLASDVSARIAAWRQEKANEANDAPAPGTSGDMRSLRRMQDKAPIAHSISITPEMAPDMETVKPPVAAPHVLHAMTSATPAAKPEDEEPLALRICDWIFKYWQRWKIEERCKRFLANVFELSVRWWRKAVEIVDKASTPKAAAFVVEPSPEVTAKPAPAPQTAPNTAAITVDKVIRRIREELAVYNAMRRAEAADAKIIDIAITSATVRLVTQTDGAAMPIRVVTAAPTGEMNLSGKAIQTVSLTIYPASDGSAPTASALPLADFPIAAYFSELRHALAAGSATDKGAFQPPLGDLRPPEEENRVEFGFSIEIGAEGGLKLAFPHTGFDAAVARRRPLENTVTVRYTVTPQGA